MKKIIKKLRLVVPAQKARTGPPLSAILGQHGLNAMTFCKTFNEKSKIFPENVDLNVKVIVYDNNSYEIIIKNVSLLNLIKKVLELGPLTTKSYYYLVLLMAHFDFSETKLKSELKSLCGTLKSFRITTYNKN